MVEKKNVCMIVNTIFWEECGERNIIKAQNSKSLKAVMHGWGQLPGGRRLQGVMSIITNHNFGFAHYGVAEPRHPEPGLPGVLL